MNPEKKTLFFGGYLVCPSHHMGWGGVFSTTCSLVLLKITVNKGGKHRKRSKNLSK